MNLADYLSELLGQQGEVSLPGLGYFVRERINGYYDDKEAKFYPPHHQVKFVAESKDDDTFAAYVALKKNISLASSKYFAEKFVSKLKEDAAKGSYLFSDLGSFYTDLDGLTFKPNDKQASDPAFYGYPAVNISKAGQPPRPEPVLPFFAKPVQTAEEHPAHAKTLRQLQQEQYLEEEYERKRSVNIWWIALIVVAVLALSVFGVYRFYPATFRRLTGSYHKMFTKDKALLPPAHHTVIPDSLSDTLIKNIPLPDTSKAVLHADTSKAVAVPDTTNLSRFEIIVASFRTLPSATVERDRYEAHNITAKIVTDAPGPLLKVSVGTYPSESEAETARAALIRSGKIPKDSGILQIKPHK